MIFFKMMNYLCIFVIECINHIDGFIAILFVIKNLEFNQFKLNEFFSELS